MARLDELAEAVAQILSMTPQPEPLRIDLLNHSPADATFFVRAVIDACERQVAPLATVKICPELGSSLERQYGGPGNGYEGIIIESDAKLSGQIEFYRFA